MTLPDEVFEESCDLQIRPSLRSPSLPRQLNSPTGSEDGKYHVRIPRVSCQYRKLSACYSEVNAQEEYVNKYSVFHCMRDQRIRQKQLYVDSSFPANDYAIQADGNVDRIYEWKRPFEIADNPRFFVEGGTRFDIQQGKLGDCWLLAAVSTLTLRPSLFQVVVPSDQGFHHKYAGIFHFRFWQYGKWEEVIIDDLLPTCKGRLVFLQSNTKNEFWSALLEKAYAKLYGNYGNLRGGTVGESLMDLTGGMVENVDLTTDKNGLFEMVEAACNDGAMIGCGIVPRDRRIGVEGRLSNGLVARHAYSVTKVTTVPYLGGKVELIRLHNPWGDDAEWSGAWSDSSPEWTLVTERERRSLGLTFDDDGEFWMPFKDFVRNFTTMDVCYVTPNSIMPITNNQYDLQKSARIKWRMRTFIGKWTAGVNAGGCRNYLDTFAMNPQFLVVLDGPDEERGRSRMIVCVMQRNVRHKRHTGKDFIPIGFVIYKLPPGILPGSHLTKNFFRYNKNCGKSPHFENSRQVSHRLLLPSGVYVVIPSTFEPNHSAEFLLRVYTEART